MAITKKGFNKTLFSVLGLVLALLIMVLVNVVFSKATWRWDATEDKLYSLSQGTRNILEALKTPVEIKVFYSRSLAEIPAHIKTYAGRVLDFLAEYEHFSDGRITITVYDPKQDSEEEEWAQKYGIKGINLPTGGSIYLGLVALSADQEETIPFLDPAGEQKLEYEITRIITRVQRPDKLKIGIISGLPIFGQPQMAMGMMNPSAAREPWLFVKELKKTYDLQEIPSAAETIEDNIDLLILYYPKNLGDKLAFAVDQYLLKGGNVIGFIDPMSVREQAPAAMTGGAIETLMNSWGVELDFSKAVLDFNYPTRLRTMNNQNELNPAWLSLTTSVFNSENLITSKLESLLLPVAGAFKKKSDSEIGYEALVQSSPNSALAETFKVRFGAEGLRREFRPGMKELDLAVQLSGNFKTSYPQGPPKTENEDDKDTQDTSETPKDWLKTSKKPSTLVLVADSDLLFDGYYVVKQNLLGFDLTRIFNDNLNFLMNAVEMLAGGESLISIRSRGRFERPFTRVQMLEQKAQDRWLEREQELVRRVEETNQKLSELEKQKDDSQRLIISSEQEEEIRRFKEERQRINRELKLVRRNLRSEIESLGARIKFINIFLIPVLVSIAGIGYALYTRRKSFMR
jgi:ABC-type uncharacterized transport system involved in gliding motility auxiliary subunit